MLGDDTLGASMQAVAGRLPFALEKPPDPSGEEKHTVFSHWLSCMPLIGALGPDSLVQASDEDCVLVLLGLLVSSAWLPCVHVVLENDVVI